MLHFVDYFVYLHQISVKNDINEQNKETISQFGKHNEKRR